jgi:hypothetical protein
MSEPTYEELQAQVAALNAELAAFRVPRVGPVLARGPHSTSEHTVVHETPEQVTLTTTHLPPTEQQFALARGRQVLAKRNAKTATPEEIAAAIRDLKSIVVSGVESAGYGDKRTEFRSLTELRQILAGLEEELEELTGTGGRIRQIRMTNQWDKGL